MYKNKFKGGDVKRIEAAVQESLDWHVTKQFIALLENKFQDEFEDDDEVLNYSSEDIAAAVQKALHGFAATQLAEKDEVDTKQLKG